MTNLTTPNIEKKPSSLRYYQDGPPHHIDLMNWSLAVTPLNGPSIALRYDDITRMPKRIFHRRMVCVCNWTIRRHWAGVLVADVLALAGVTETPDTFIRQTSTGSPDKGRYESTISLADAISRNAILAYEVDGLALPLEQGFPLRLIDFGLYGYKCVKAVNQLEIVNEARLGKWEEQAGYDLDGTVRKKRYWFVDRREHIFVDTEGEVVDL